MSEAFVRAGHAHADPKLENRMYKTHTVQSFLCEPSIHSINGCTETGCGRRRHVIGLLFPRRQGSCFGGIVTETLSGREGDVTST